MAGYDPNINKERLRNFSGGAAPNRLSSQTDRETAAEVASQRTQDVPEPVVLTRDQEALFDYDTEDSQWAGLNHDQIWAKISEQTGVPYPGAPASRYPGWGPDEDTPGPRENREAMRQRALAEAPKIVQTTLAPEPERTDLPYDTITLKGVRCWLVPEDEFTPPERMNVGGVTYYLVPM